MFWEGKIDILSLLEAYFRQRDLSLVISSPTLPLPRRIANCDIVIGSLEDSEGISRLLNKEFDTKKVRTNTTPEWIARTFKNKAIWVVAKDIRGTIRACISSFEITAPYPNSISQCQNNIWGIVDWFCVDPLWRGKGIASKLLKLIDYITYQVGRKALIFLKEGYPLPFQIPVYSTRLQCRKAGNPMVSRMREGTGLDVYDYHCVERSSGLPMIRITGLETPEDLEAWEKTLDTELPPCWVFVNGSSIVDSRKGWKPDSLVSMYAFRWIPGKWLGKKPHPDII